MKEDGNGFLFYSDVSNTWRVSSHLNEFLPAIFQTFGSPECPLGAPWSDQTVQCLDGAESDGYIRENIAGWEVRYEPGVFEYEPALRYTLTKGRTNFYYRLTLQLSIERSTFGTFS